MKKGLFPERSSGPDYPTLDDWILHEAIPLSVDSSEYFNASIIAGGNCAAANAACSAGIASRLFAAIIAPSVE